jgi:alkylation response protein AidB-like acyl-CoA dehydrogenase
MDFEDSPQEARFRAELCAWMGPALAALPASDTLDLTARRDTFRLWQRALFDAGYAGLTWPTAYGGRGAGVMERAIFVQEADRMGAPEPLNSVGEGYAGPTIIDFGTEEQRARFLRPILTGEDLWCQLFSEPGAGSDLAALQTRAERVEGGWSITGQKVWTSRAQIASYAILLARTGGGPRHKGITFFLLPMDQPGVVVRPLRQITGESEFNEVFLDEAFVSDDLVVGAIDDGWRVTRATLQYERVTLAVGRINVGSWVEELLEEAAAVPGGVDDILRERLARVHAEAHVSRLIGQRVLTGMARGDAPGPESSVGKLYLHHLLEEVCALGLELGGPAARLASPEDEVAGRWQHRALWVRGMALAGGTPQIQRSIVAERVLGLPRS